MSLRVHASAPDPDPWGSDSEIREVRDSQHGNVSGSETDDMDWKMAANGRREQANGRGSEVSEDKESDIEIIDKPADWEKRRYPRQEGAPPGRHQHATRGQQPPTVTVIGLKVVATQRRDQAVREVSIEGIRVASETTNSRGQEVGNKGGGKMMRETAAVLGLTITKSDSGRVMMMMMMMISILMLTLVIIR